MRFKKSFFFPPRKSYFFYFFVICCESNWTLVSTAFVEQTVKNIVQQKCIK